MGHPTLRDGAAGAWMLTALRLHLYNNLAQNLEPFCSLSLKHQEQEYPPHGNWEAATGKESPLILPVMAPVPPSCAAASSRASFPVPSTHEGLSLQGPC